MSAVCKAIEQKRFRQVRLLVELGADVNRQDERSGKTPLVAACFLENEELACQIARCLLNNGADVGRKDREGLTALMQACRLGKRKVVTELLKTQECDLRATDRDGNTALMHSVMAGNSDVAKTLTVSLNRYQLRGVDIANKAGETPLIKAAKLGHTGCKYVLLQDGKASPNARDMESKLTASEWEELIESKKRDNNVMPAVQRSLVSTRSVTLHQTRPHKDKGLKPEKRQDMAPKETSWVVANEINNISRKNYADSSESMDPTQTETSARSVYKPHGPKRLITTGSTCKDIFLKDSSRRIEKKKLSIGAHTSPSTVTGRKHSATSRRPACSELDDKVMQSDEEVKQSVHKKDTNYQAMIVNSGNETHGVRITKENGAEAVIRKELPNLLSVWAHQKSPSFRPSVKPPPPEKIPETKAELRAKIIDLWYKGDKNTRRSSVSTERSTSQVRRFSKVGKAVRTWKRFSSIYSRGDFETLRTDKIGTQYERRSSLATPDLRTRPNAYEQTRRSSVGNLPSPSLSTVKLWESYPGKNVRRRSKGQSPAPVRKHSEIIKPSSPGKELKSTGVSSNESRIEQYVSKQMNSETKKETLASVREEPAEP